MKLLSYISTAGVQDSLISMDAGKNELIIIASIILLTILVLIKVYSVKKI